MSIMNNENLGLFQIKTTLKGIYFAFSLFLFFFIGRILKILPDSFEDLFNSDNNTEYIEEIILFVTFASLFSAFLYYTKIENYLALTLFKFRNSGVLRDYKNVSLKNSFNHPFIEEDKNRMYSIVYLILILYTINISYLWLLKKDFLLVLVSIIIFPNILILDWKKNIKKKWIIYIIFILLFISLILILVFYSFISLFFIIPILILLFKCKSFWTSTRKKVIFIYFKNLFIQRRESLNDTQKISSIKNVDIIKEFIENVERRLWIEVEINFHNLLEHIQDDIKNNIKKKFNKLKYVVDQFNILNRNSIFPFIKALCESYYINDQADDWKINYSPDKHNEFSNQTFQFENELKKLFIFLKNLYFDKYYFYVFVIFDNPFYYFLDTKLKNLNSLIEKNDAIREESIKKLDEELQKINPKTSEKDNNLIPDHLEQFFESYKNNLKDFVEPQTSMGKVKDQYLSFSDLKNNFKSLKTRIKELLGGKIFKWEK